jgi:eukaryotic-like serine/threonine-protein kinase
VVQEPAEVLGQAQQRQEEPEDCCACRFCVQGAILAGFLKGWKLNRLMLLAAGMAAFATANAAAPAGPAFELALVDMQGQKKVLGTIPDMAAPRVSPDGKRVAFEQPDTTGTYPQSMLIHVAELDKLDKRRALQPTLTTTRNHFPAWSHDSGWVVFVATGNGSDSIFRELADGSIQPKYVVDGKAPEGLHEGGRLTFLTLKGEKDYGVALFNMNTKKTTRFDQAGTAQYSSTLSRDGQWIAFTSNETGRPEVWLQSVTQELQRVQVTRQGGAHPQFSADGSAIYYDQGGKIFRISVALDDRAPRASGDPVALPISGFQQGEIQRQYDLTPDGKGFVMLFPVAK